MAKGDFFGFDPNDKLSQRRMLQRKDGWAVIVEGGGFGTVHVAGPLVAQTLPLNESWSTISQLPPPRLELQCFPTIDIAEAWLADEKYKALQAAYALGWRPVTKRDEWGAAGSLKMHYRLRYEDLVAGACVIPSGDEPSGQ